MFTTDEMIDAFNAMCLFSDELNDSKEEPVKLVDNDKVVNASYSIIE